MTPEAIVGICIVVAIAGILACTPRLEKPMDQSTLDRITKLEADITATRAELATAKTDLAAESAAVTSALAENKDLKDKLAAADLASTQMAADLAAARAANDPSALNAMLDKLDAELLGLAAPPAADPVAPPPADAPPPAPAS